MTNMTTIDHKPNYPNLGPAIQVTSLPGLLIGHHPTSPYVAKFWLPLLGPDALSLWQHLASRLVDTCNEGFSTSPQELYDHLGLMTSPTPTARLQQAIAKLTANDHAHGTNDEINVRQAVPNLTSQQIQGLPYGLKTDHQQLEDAAMWSHHDPTNEAHAELIAKAMTDRGFCHVDINVALQCLNIDPHAIANADINPLDH